MKTVFITGINRGLGKALFNLFSTKGYFVYGLLRNEEAAKLLIKENLNNVKIIQADLASDTAIQRIQAIVQDQPIDFLINNAGISGKEFLLENIPSSEISQLFEVHCLGVFRTVKALRKNLLQADNPIVLNLNSRLGSITRQSNGTYQHLTSSYSYRIAKAAQNMLTNCFRAEFKGKIQFLSIHPGRMKTEIAHSDADVEPATIAQRLWMDYENNQLKEENGIVELGKEIMEW